MGAYTSSATGNWASTGTWGGTGPPGDGDTATIANGHTVTIAASTTVVVGDSANPGTHAIRTAGTSGTGILAVGNSANVTIKGNVLQGNASWTIGNGVTLEFDNATALVWATSDAHNLANAKLTVTGTSGSHTIIRSKSGGANASFTGAFLRSGRLDATYVDFTRIGTASVDALQPYCTNGADVFRLDHCTFTACGRVYTPGNLATNATFEIKDCAWSGTVSTEAIQAATYTNAIGTGARNLLRNDIDKTCTFTTKDFTYQHNIFRVAPTWVVSNDYAWATFNQNVIVKPTAVDTNVPYGMTNTFWLCNFATYNPHFFSVNDRYAMTFDGLILQYTGSAADGDGVILAGGSTIRRHNVTRCLVLPASAGATASCTLLTQIGAFNLVGTLEHNTVITDGGIRNAIQVNETTASAAGALSYVRANLFASIAGLTGGTDSSAYVVSYPGSVGVDNIFDPAGATNNGLCGLGTTSRASGKTNQGTSYDTPTTVTVPGANDVATNPNFVDKTRNFEQYATTKSQSATVANTLAILASDPATEIPAMLAWIRAGFRPQASSLNGATYGGDAMTLDAAGNSLTGTIGAMAYLAPSATAFTLSGPSTGAVGVASTNFTITPTGGVYTGTITPNDSSGGGSFAPTSLTWSGDAAAKTFTYTPASAGAKTINGTGSPSLTPPANLTYTASSSLAIGSPTVTATGHHTASVSWSAATGGTSPYTYIVQRAPDVSGSPGTFASVSSAQAGTTYTNAGLDPSTKYHYRIRATDNAAATVDSGANSATTTIPDIPNYALWWSRMVSYLAAFNTTLSGIDGTNFNVNSHLNHDGAYGAIQGLAMRPGNADLTAYLGHQIRLYRDVYLVPNGGALPGYYLFPEGLANDWTANASTTSKNALISLRTNGLYVNGGTVTNESLSRECAYALLTQMEADRVSATAWDSARVAALVNAALGHIDKWIGNPSVWSAEGSSYIQPFMMGITGTVLAKYLDYIESAKATTDARILPALARLAVRMREKWWLAASSDFTWPINDDGSDPSPGVPTDVLNNESTPFFGWLYKRTGCVYFKTAGDESFGNGIDTADVVNPKQWNQQYRWTFLYTQWRQATLVNDNAFYVVDPPFTPSGAVGVASASFVVVPMKSFTGTITPSDAGNGGTFAPTSLAWSGTGESKTFTYTPLTSGVKTVSLTNTGSLSNPASLAYTANGPAANAFTLSGPSTGAVGVASTNFTITPTGGVYTGTITPNDSSGGGTFAPTSLTWSGDAAAKTFTYTPLTSGAKTVSASAIPSLVQPSNLTYTATDDAAPVGALVAFAVVTPAAV